MNFLFIQEENTASAYEVCSIRNIRPSGVLDSTKFVSELKDAKTALAFILSFVYGSLAYLSATFILFGQCVEPTWETYICITSF